MNNKKAKDYAKQCGVSNPDKITKKEFRRVYRISKRNPKKNKQTPELISFEYSLDQSSNQIPEIEKPKKASVDSENEQKTEKEPSNLTKKPNIGKKFERKLKFPPRVSLSQTDQEEIYTPKANASNPQKETSTKRIKGSVQKINPPEISQHRFGARIPQKVPKRSQPSPGHYFNYKTSTKKPRRERDSSRENSNQPTKEKSPANYRSNRENSNQPPRENSRNYNSNRPDFKKKTSEPVFYKPATKRPEKVYNQSYANSRQNNKFDRSGREGRNERFGYRAPPTRNFYNYPSMRENYQSRRMINPVRTAAPVVSKFEPEKTNYKETYSVYMPKESISSRVNLPKHSSRNLPYSKPRWEKPSYSRVSDRSEAAAPQPRILGQLRKAERTYQLFDTSKIGILSDSSADKLIDYSFQYIFTDLCFKKNGVEVEEFLRSRKSIKDYQKLVLRLVERK